MIDHIGLEVSDVAASKAFYDSALEPLGISVVMHWEDKAFGYGIVDKPDFWIHQRGKVGAPVHVAFSAPDRGTVDEFHRAALEAGGRDNGPPGPRSYHESYYGAFVLDPDGNNIEAVCHRPPEL
jgi:catechol 2,3-dioxygenase-like lactoylglutathione lyase family enzyme